MEQKIEVYYRNRNIVQTFNGKYVKELQEYIHQHHISSENLEELDDWLDDHRQLYLQIRKDGGWIYTSDYSMDGAQAEMYDMPEYPGDNYYDIELMDGAAQVFIMGSYYYSAYMAATMMEIVIAFLLFILIFMLGIRKKIQYLNRLSEDIEILEGGNLDYDVHVEGKDEIADLATGLNSMKESFQNQIREVEELTKTNQKMVTEISHDLRTPLTSVLLYAEILKNNRFPREEDRQIILEKITKKIGHMKELSDGLLEYAVKKSEEKYVPAEYQPIQSILYDELSDMCQYLEDQELNVRTNMQWQKGQILVCEEYLTRILDNISSNVIKYADRHSVVLLWDEYYKEEMCITCENTCRSDPEKQEGYHIGIQNVRMMMEEMGGSCKITQTKEVFRICLRFRYRSEET